MWYYDDTWHSDWLSLNLNFKANVFVIREESSTETHLICTIRDWWNLILSRWKNYYSPLQIILLRNLSKYIGRNALFSKDTNPNSLFVVTIERNHFPRQHFYGVQYILHCVYYIHTFSYIMYGQMGLFFIWTIYPECNTENISFYIHKCIQIQNSSLFSYHLFRWTQ